MIYSMTAFARQEIQAEWGNAVWELRSVNHRYLDVSFRLPETLNNLETNIREKIKTKLQRGKIEINLRYKPTAISTNQITLNKELVKQLVVVQDEVTQLVKETKTFNLGDILRWPGVILMSEENTQKIHQDLLTGFTQALQEFIAIRQQEGAALQILLQQRLTAMQIEIDKVKKHSPTILKLQREKLINRFNDAKITLDATRLEQEMLLFTQKIDITEELDRLEMHIKEVERTLQKGGAVGRRLDFLLQELNREANTLGSKSIATETTLAAVELKVLIEQIREQVQNIE